MAARKKKANRRPKASRGDLLRLSEPARRDFIAKPFSTPRVRKEASFELFTRAMESNSPIREGRMRAAKQSFDKAAAKEKRRKTGTRKKKGKRR